MTLLHSFFQQQVALESKANNKHSIQMPCKHSINNKESYNYHCLRKINFLEISDFQMEMEMT